MNARAGVLIPVAVAISAVFVVTPATIADATPRPRINQREEQNTSHPKTGYRAVAASSNLHYSTNAVRAGSEFLPAIGDWGNLMERITQLRSLRDGWIGEGSITPDRETLDWIDNNIRTLATSDAKISVIPLSDGTLSITWHKGATEFSAEVRSAEIYVFADDTATDQFTESIKPRTSAALAEALSLAPLS
jgi:hypothetical protein